ncbi:Ribonuclease H-like domain [Cinara cedri]|uniref:Ribonuclease H-like domain n=1 Tax=Cinara cedri TaxID=506608 RepID=A0A5E4MQF7_9HEMI|nr:Ribonuclease H-like domain [Cinara cedri]
MKGQNTTIIQNHKLMSYGIYVNEEDDISTELLEEFDIPTEPIIYRGTGDEPDVARHFVEQIVNIGKKVTKLLKTNKPIIMTAEEVQRYVTCQHCNLCNGGFSAANSKIADHNNLSGKYQQKLSNTCNLKCQTLKLVPCFFYNLSNYESYFIVTELGWGKLEEDTLTEKEDFYSTLTKKNIEKNEYVHARKVWGNFGYRTLGEYSDLYVFENFRDICMMSYNLVQAYYYTAPGFNYDVTLKYTRIGLELLSDYDMLLMFERGIHGDFVQPSMRYVKANNITVEDYDKMKEDS